MMTRFASAYNAINLIRNGGLDFLKDTVTVPPYWEILNATGGGVPPINAFSIVLGEDPKSEAGAANFFRFVLSNTEEVVLRQEFIERFIQPGFIEELGVGWNQAKWGRQGSGHDRLDPDPITIGCQAIYNTPVTVSMSIRIKRGAAKVALRAQLAYTTNVIDVVVYDAQISEEWLRPSALLSLGANQIKSLSVVLSKIDVTGLCEIDVGAIQMSVGDLGDLPYTGDPAAEAVPKGAIVLAYGVVCPPGYEKMAFTPPAVSGRIFFKGGAPLATPEGEEKHNHTATQTMNPELDWPTRDVIPAPFGEAYGVTPDNADESHQHNTGEAVHVPPTRDVIFCKRL